VDEDPASSSVRHDLKSSPLPCARGKKINSACVSTRGLRIARSRRSVAPCR
jgi:hypothetical protein